MSLHENFEKAAADAKSFAKRPSDDVLLQLYGLYKQAISGDNTSEAPWAIQFEAKAKWDAWNANKGISQDEAKQKYIDLVEQLRKEHS